MFINHNFLRQRRAEVSVAYARPEHSARSPGEVLSASSPRLPKVFAESLRGRPTPEVLCEVTRRSGQSWSHGASDWLVSLWRHGPVVGHCFRRDSTDARKVAKKQQQKTKNGITDWGWDWSFYWISAGISDYCGSHLIPAARIKIKAGDATLHVAEAIGRRGLVDPLCSYWEPKSPKTSSRRGPSSCWRSYIKNGLHLLKTVTFRYSHVTLKKKRKKKVTYSADSESLTNSCRETLSNLL